MLDPSEAIRVHNPHNYAIAHFSPIFTPVLPPPWLPCALFTALWVSTRYFHTLEPRKEFWKMNRFVPVSLDPEDGLMGYLLVCFISAPPEDGQSTYLKH
jgi:hypothetical protein